MVYVAYAICIVYTLPFILYTLPFILYMIPSVLYMILIFTLTAGSVPQARTSNRVLPAGGSTFLLPHRLETHPHRSAST